MVWQDILIFILQGFMGYALVPQIYYNFKKRKTTLTYQTLILTTIPLFAIAFVFLSLKLYLATAISIIMGILWMILLIQKMMY